MQRPAKFIVTIIVLLLLYFGVCNQSEPQPTPDNPNPVKPVGPLKRLWQRLTKTAVVVPEEESPFVEESEPTQIQSFYEPAPAGPIEAYAAPPTETILTHRDGWGINNE